MKKSKAFWVYIIFALVIYTIVQVMISGGTLDLYYQNILIQMCINIMLAVSLHIVIGITGQFSIGHAGFMAVGAYFSAIATMNLGLPFFVALIIGAVAAGFAGLLVGIPTLRLKGDYLAIATLGFAEIIRIVFLNIDYVGGAAGMVVTNMTTWTFAFVGVVLTIFVIANFTNSRHGRGAIAIREDEIAADAMGINTTYYKVVAFTIGAIFAGLAGGIYSHNFFIIQPTTFNFLKSFDILIYVVLGGLGSLSGSVIAAIFLTIVSAYLSNFPETRMIIYSLVLILVMLYRPTGLMGTKEITHLFKFGKKGGSKV
ncbi:branched-chain amino acid ABC transporter permease [Ureibacillus sp. Re31]|uniref:Branched-chain amino acid ABC transporter permease n=1 Tax=Ureibacillus galli TaxID=2762222 RepID=A0ABR8XDB3_9BACL|nr:branched-chain amino acid ABC transporter permease [Ureibacillus galli]MBD8027209.1 branched-chain amino acid ABC transporter permease [Ureibacillus galli]